MDDTLDPKTPSGTIPDAVRESLSPHVLPLVRPFDPVDHDAEEQYDAVVRRLNRVRARRTRLTRELERLERPFLEGEPTVQSGPRQGQPLSVAGRKRRLTRLVEVGAALREATAEERFAVDALDRMNQALDRWARETWGG